MCGGGFLAGNLFRPQFLFQSIFFSVLGTHIFRNTSERLLKCFKQKFILFLCFFKKLGPNFQQTRTWNLSSYSGCFHKNFPQLFRRQKQLSKGVPQRSSCLAERCDKIQLLCTSGQKQESVTCKFTKIEPRHRYFSKNLAASSEKQY